MFKEIKACRICGNSELVPVLNLGVQTMTGIFPRSKDDHVSMAPLELVKCSETNANTCGLLQLRHVFPLGEMYGENYGYRSGLNQGMVRHLSKKLEYILSNVTLERGDLVIDIGSNDGTLLSMYPADKGLSLLGVDPTAKKFEKYYPKHVQILSEFFSGEKIKALFSQRQAKIITSIAMFYDLEQPLAFMESVRSLLHRDGIWVFEQSYMPTMLQQTSYDTVCHEHLEYYRLKQIQWMAERAGLKIIDVSFNDANGGSFAVTAARSDSGLQQNGHVVRSLLEAEVKAGYENLDPFRKFEVRVARHRIELQEVLKKLVTEGKKILGYGASTKGNVILQYCGITPDLLPYIAEVNSDKFGCLTPGSYIPIISEEEAKAMRPDYFMVLPWHFRSGIIQREENYLSCGGSFIFPLPEITIVSSHGRQHGCKQK